MVVDFKCKDCLFGIDYVVLYGGRKMYKCYHFQMWFADIVVECTKFKERPISAR